MKLLIDELNTEELETKKYTINNPIKQQNTTKLFDLKLLEETLKQNSHNKNKNYSKYSENLSGYDISKKCIRDTLFRIRSIPVQDYSDKWLPVSFRNELGTSVHNFLQTNGSNQFTELEVTLKVPSLHVSCRLDGLIGNNVLVEIKSCPYSDYDTIIKKNQPRQTDFYQALLYKYLIENYLEEIKQQQPSRGGKLPQLNKYNIEHIQFIYVCHELAVADSDDLNSAVKFAGELRKSLNSQKNPFWFLTTLTIDMTSLNIDPYIDYLKKRIEQFNYYLQNGQTPPKNHPYVDMKSCFFCLYKDYCGKIA